VIAVLLLDALVLGLIACVLGLAPGDELSIRLFHTAPGYLSSAFVVGSQRVVGVESVAVAAGGRILLRRVDEGVDHEHLLVVAAVGEDETTIVDGAGDPEAIKGRNQESIVARSSRGPGGCRALGRVRRA